MVVKFFLLIKRYDAKLIEKILVVVNERRSGETFQEQWEMPTKSLILQLVDIKIGIVRKRVTTTCK